MPDGPDIQAVTRQEWRRVGVFAVLVMAFTTLPYLLGWLAAGDGWTFGGFVFGADDGYSYLAKMRLGARGDWLFTLRYTSEPHDGALLFLPYLLLGQITGLFVEGGGPDLAITFHVARIVFGTLLILVSYRFVAAFLRRPGARMVALVLVVLGGGLGWLLALLGRDHLLGALPLDFYVPEGYSFLILFGLPHLALARSGLLGGLLLLFRGLAQPDEWRWPVLAGLCWAVMGLCVPFYVAVLYVLLGCWGLAVWLRHRAFPWALFWRAALAGIIAAPVLLYSGLVFLTSDVLREWSAQNQLAAPHPLHYVFGYIVLAVPAVAALRGAWRMGTPPHLLLATWVVIALPLVYLPINVQRRLAEGVIVPLGVLAVAGVNLAFSSRRARTRAQNVLLALALPTTLLLWAGAMVSVLSPGRPLFRPPAERAALAALDDSAPQDAVVLSVKQTGNVIPAYTGLVAYVGHGPETIDSDEKTDRAEQFFAGDLDARTAHALLDAVDYVFYGPLEVEYSATPAWDIAAAYPRLTPIYAQGDYTIYEVTPRDST